AGGSAKGPGALMEQRLQAVAAGGIERGLGRMGAWGLGLESGEPPRVERVDGIADGLVVAAQGAGNGGRRMPRESGQENRAPTDGKAAGGAEPGGQCRLFVGRQRSNKEWCLHTEKYTACPMTLSATAIGRGLPQPTRIAQGLRQGSRLLD